MKKILLDLGIPGTKEQIHEYLAEKMEFPDYYGGNLDALYDMLTDIAEDTYVELSRDTGEKEEDLELGRYLESVQQVFQDAEEENPHLCVVIE